MRIATIGKGLPTAGTKPVPYFSQQSLLDFDLVIWDPQWVGNEYQATEAGSLMPYECVEHRAKELKRFFELGRCLVLFLPWPALVQVTHPSGNLMHRELTTLLPVAANTQASSGSEMEVRGASAPVRLFWNANKHLFEYRAYFTSAQGSPFLFVAQTDWVVGTLV